MAKTKNYSIRFDENNLLLAQNLSGIKKPQKLVDELILAYVKHLKGSPIELPKDYIIVERVGVVDSSGKTKPILPIKKEVSQSPEKALIEKMVELGNKEPKWKLKNEKPKPPAGLTWLQKQVWIKEHQ